MSAEPTDDLTLIAQCLAEAEKRIRALEANPSARHSDINRLEAQVMGLRKELDFAHTRVAESAKREFGAKEDALGVRLEAGLEKVRKDLQVNIRGLNPRGNWTAGMVLNRNDVVTLNGTSYLVLRDGVTVKPSAGDTKNFQILARRGGGGGGGFSGIADNFVGAPASASASGQPGQWSYDAEYYYICVAANTWLRTSLATW